MVVGSSQSPDHGLSPECKKDLYSRPLLTLQLYHQCHCLLDLFSFNFVCRKHDYDLCNICFGRTGNDADYVRLDSPLNNRDSWDFNGFHNQVCNQ